MINTEIKFRINVTIEGYENKQDAQACLSSAGAKAIGRNKMAFKEQNITVNQFLDYAIKGHAFCNLYQYDKSQKYWITNKKGQKYLMFPEYQRGTNKGAMKVCFKRDEFFYGSQAIFVDVDFTKYNSVEDYIGALEIKPTAVYMSFSDGIAKHDVISRRFHMVYIFNEILNKEQFELVSKVITYKAEIDTNEPMDDDCGTRLSQYMNGCYDNSEVYNTNITYLYNDFKEYINIYNNNIDINNNIEDVENRTTTYYNESEKNEHYENEEKVDVISEKTSEASEPLELISKSLINDMDRLEYDEFMKYNRHKYQYIYRIEKPEWIDDTYQYVDEGYFSLFWNAHTLKDGQKRKKKCFERMCLRRVMYNDIDADTLLFNAYEDVHRFFDNTDGDLGIDYLVRNVTNAMALSIEEIEDKYSDNIAYLRSKAPKQGIILKKGVAFDLATRNKKLKEIRYNLIDEIYDTNLSVKENLKLINDNLFTLGKDALYSYCKSRNIITNSSKTDRDNEILSVYDFCMSLRKNFKAINDMGIKVSLGKLSNLIKEYNKDMNNNIDNINQLEEDIYSTTYYNESEKCEHPNNTSKSNDNIEISNITKDNDIVFDKNGFIISTPSFFSFSIPNITLEAPKATTADKETNNNNNIVFDTSLFNFNLNPANY